MKDKLSAHPVEKYWKERKQREKQKNRKRIQKHSKQPSIESLEEEITSLIQKKNEGVLLSSERERLRYLVRLHDNILDKHSRNSSHKESSKDPLDPEYGEDNRQETKERLQAFRRILQKTSNYNNAITEEPLEEEPTRQPQPLKTNTAMVPLQVYQPNVQKTRETSSRHSTEESIVEQELNHFYAELQDMIGNTQSQ